MARERGRTVPLSLPRKWVCDLMHFSKKVPIITGERSIRISPFIAARKSVPQPPSWSTVMLKAFGIVSMRMPELRRCYLSFPYPRLYEMPYSVGAVVLDRDFEGEHAVFGCPVVEPETRDLAELQRRLDNWKTEPVLENGALRRLVRTTKWPRPIRRLAWWYGLSVDGYQKARNFGTFAINSLAGYRSRAMMMLFPVTTFVYYGAPEKDGSMPIQIGFDHRVFDGYTGGRAMSELETVLNGTMAEEMKALREAKIRVKGEPGA